MAAPWVAVGALGEIVVGCFYNHQDATEILQIILIAIFLVGFFIGVYVYRCPICNRFPEDADGIMLDPESCPNCGVRLKPGRLG